MIASMFEAVSEVYLTPDIARTRLRHAGEAQRQASSERRLGDDEDEDAIHGVLQFVWWCGGRAADV